MASLHLDLAGRVVLLTGATGGLGRALARRLAEADARLVVSARSSEDLDRLIHELPEGAEVRGIAADLALPGEAGRLAREAAAVWDRLEVLINNAGVGYNALIEETDEKTTRRVFEVNTFSPLALTLALLPRMAALGEGLIVNIESCSGRGAIPTRGIYSASKSALAVLSNTLRVEVEPLGIRVLDIFPGTLDTNFDEHAYRESRRPGLCLSGGGCGADPAPAAERIVAAMGRGSGELWLDRRARAAAGLAALWLGWRERKVRPLRDWARARPTDHTPREERRWQLVQVETSIACNLECVMCPWTCERDSVRHEGLMPERVWQAVASHLDRIASLDFSGGGEPLLHPRFFDRMAEAKAAQCRVGFLTNGTLMGEAAVESILEIGVDWVAVSIDGATAEVYESIRKGAAFETVCGNLERLAVRRSEGHPRLMINFLMMPDTVCQLEEMVRLAADLGVDVLQLKQADVSRGEAGSGFALFHHRDDKQLHQLRRAVRRARRLGEKLGIEVTQPRFQPEETPVCGQDPRTALFVRYDGVVAPCINLAVAGPSSFLGEPVEFPAVHYGRLPEDSLDEIWDSDLCLFYRETFEERERAHDKALAGEDFPPNLLAMQEAFNRVIAAMPQAPEGCRTCHYLYGL